MGFPVVKELYCKNIDESLSACESIAKNRESLGFEADGAVIKINSRIIARDLGIVGKDPRGSMAYKFPAREISTKLVEIGVNVGRTGVLTPLAILEPVMLGGVTIKQATLHNFDFVSEKDIRIGDQVMLKRSGDVIPYVIGPIKELRTGQETIFVPPSTCPSCGQAVEHFEGEVFWYCVNAACPAQLIRNLEHFVSRGAMDIEGLGIKLVEQFVDMGLVKDVADLYRLEKSQLLTLDGFAEKKATNVLEAINDSKNRPLSRLINALGIRGVGEVVANDLAKVYNDLDALANASALDLQQIEGIGPNIAEAIVDWFAQPGNRTVLNKIHNAGVWPRSIQSKPLSNSLSGYIFVITGTLPGLTREQVKALITENGGKVSETVSNKTNFIVAGENPGSKLIKAQVLGISVIEEPELRKLVGI
jgi:DNA ligase (NAD+)